MGRGRSAPFFRLIQQALDSNDDGLRALASLLNRKATVHFKIRGGTSWTVVLTGKGKGSGAMHQGRPVWGVRPGFSGRQSPRLFSRRAPIRPLTRRQPLQASNASATLFFVRIQPVQAEGQDPR